MDDINTIYHNDYGIAFQWKKSAIKDHKKVQLVFRNTGLYLSLNELVSFSKTINRTISKPQMCKDCKHNNECKSILLETPASQISFAVSYIELKQIQDLLKGTLFQLQLENVFKENDIFKRK